MAALTLRSRCFCSQLLLRRIPEDDPEDSRSLRSPKSSKASPAATREGLSSQVRTALLADAAAIRAQQFCTLRGVPGSAMPMLFMGGLNRFFRNSPTIWWIAGCPSSATRGSGGVVNSSA